MSREEICQTTSGLGHCHRVPILWSALMLGATAVLSSQAQTDRAPVEILPLEEEVRIALSAAPQHLRDGAGVYALTASGFQHVRESRNGFTCVINRDHPLNRKPVCYDAEGTATILPKVLFVGEALLRGVRREEVERQVAARFASGEFISPRRAGVAYMLTREIRNYNSETKKIGTFPPHIMVYAPNLTDQDIGATWDRDARRKTPWLPFIGYQGPHGFIIVVVGEQP